MSRIEIDPKMQPPSANKKVSNAAADIKKGLERDKLLVDVMNEEDSSDVKSVGATTKPGDKGEVVELTMSEMGQEDNSLPEIEISDNEWLQRSRVAYDSSTSYFDNNVRVDLENSIRAFHNQHKSSSHFATTNNSFSSKIFRPKTRSALMKYEAAADAAYFSNPDVISIEAQNPNDKNEVVSAAVVKSLMQYRLTKTIPWYQVVIGGFQDAQVQSLAIAHYYWKVKTGEKIELNEFNEEVKSKFFEEDKPAVDLIPLENFRFDPNANWMDVVNSSPFLIYLRPMFIGDILAKMEEGYFDEMSKDDILAAITKRGESTRTLRAQSGQDPQSTATKELADYEVVMVQEHIHRVNGQDYIWYTLNNQEMLKKPVPIKEVYFTGDRQFVVGQCVIETHNPYSSSIPTLVSGVQEEINEVANQRLNNVKLAMNKKFIIRSDSEIDLAALLRNQPGSAVYTQDPDKDVRELSTPDITQSSYLEQDRLNSDFDELVSNFNPQGMQGQPAGGADTWRGMQMLNSNANVVLEHQLRIFTQTFVEPLLRGLIRLEAKYETDDVVLALVGKQQSQLMMRYGINEVTDEMLNHDLTVKVNVGMGMTDPNTKTQKLITVISMLEKLMASPIARGFDMKEVAKELFANAGYGDGLRFINQDLDPQQAQLLQENMMLKKKIQDKTMHEQVGLQKVREGNQTKLAIANLKEHSVNARYLADKAYDAASQSTVGQQPQQQGQIPNQPKV